MAGPQTSWTIFLLLLVTSTTAQQCLQPAPCGGGGGGGGGGDYNPALNNGQRGNPGFMAKFNARGFQYLSNIADDLIASEIPKTRLDPISQSIPEFNGYINAYNLYLSRFRRPTRTAIYPSEPNHINIAVQNFDLGVTGNLAGQLVVLIPLQISGIIDVIAQGVSITMVTSLEADCSGRPIVRVLGCSATVDYINVNIINGGLIGNIINTQFKSQIVGMLSPVLTKLLCQKASEFVTKDLSSKLSQLPTRISIGQLIGQLLNLGAKTGICKTQRRTSKVLQHAGKVQRIARARGVAGRQTKHIIRSRPVVIKKVRTVKQSRSVVRSASSYVIRTQGSKSFAGEAPHPPAKVPPGAETIIDPNAGGPNDPTFKADTSCTNPGDSLSAITSLFDFHRLDNFYLDLGLVRQPHATQCCLAIDLRGEIAPGGSCTPFGPTAMSFPCCGTKMVEALVSDHVINSFLYHAHKQGIFRATLDSNTPKIGKFLKTTCPAEATDDDDDDDDSDSESGGGGLGGLNICLGDIVPALRDKYPDKLVQLQISTERAPSIIFRRANGGSAHIDLAALVDVIAMANPPAKVGTIGVEAIADISVKFQGIGRVSGSVTFEKLKLSDKTGTLGLPQIALDNISQLGKGLVEKLINDQLKNGLPISLPSNLPIKISNPMINIYDRYIHLESDFSIDPSLIATLASASSSNCGSAVSQPCG